MATIDEQLAKMYAARPAPRKPRVAKVRLPAVRPRPPARWRDMPPLPRVSPEELKQINRAHGAAMKMIHGKKWARGELDGALLLSYVIWPTPAIVEALERAAEAA